MSIDGRKRKIYGLRYRMKKRGYRFDGRNHYCYMPDDPANRMAISVHYYTPASFAILEEDADWAKATSTWGTDSDVKELNGWMDMMKQN